MSIKKIIVTAMASATILGLGANVQPTIHARHVRTYRVRRHRTYRRRNFRKVPKRNKRARRTKRAKQDRKARKSRRINRKRHGRRLTRRVSRTRRPKRARRMHRTRHIARHHGYRKARGLNKYVYNISNPTLLKTMAYDNDMSINKLLHKYSTNGKSVKAYDLGGMLTPISEAKYEARTNGQSLSAYINESNPGIGKLTSYNIEGTYMALTKPQLKDEAQASDMTVPELLKNAVKHANKYMDDQGMPTVLGQHIAEDYAIKDLNQIRESKGIAPLTKDPDLEFLAEKRAGLNQNISHFDKNGNDYSGMISDDYHIPYAGGENVSTYCGEPFHTPKQIGEDEQEVWDSIHEEARESPSYTKVGIGINPNGITAEEFGL